MGVESKRLCTESRLLELDCFRGVAALWVLLFHYTVRYEQLYNKYEDNLLFSVPNGVLPVYLFFMISGFVIFMTLERCESAWDFISSRFSRLYPAYWAGMFLTLTVGVFWPLPGQVFTISQVLVNTTMFQGYLYVKNIDGVYWSLGYELAFYWVMLSLYLTGMLKRIFLVSVVWICVGACANIWDGFLWNRVRMLFVLQYAHLFVAGIMFYHFWKKKEPLLSAGVIVACIAAHYFLVKSLLNVCIILIFSLCFFLAINRHLDIVRRTPLIWLGTISYPLYLIHQMIGYRIIRVLILLGWNANAAVVVASLLMCFLASALTYCVERPATKWLRDRYWALKSSGRCFGVKVIAELDD